MSLECEDQELLEGFLTETAELLEKLDDDLVALGKSAGRHGSSEPDLPLDPYRQGSLQLPWVRAARQSHT